MNRKFLHWALLLFTVAFFSLCSCTKRNGPDTPQVDTDGIAGNHDRYFYKTESATKATVLVIKQIALGAHKAVSRGLLSSLYSVELITLSSGQITSRTLIDSALVQISADGTSATIQNETGIWEASATAPAKVTGGEAPLPVATIDAVCTGVDPAGYSELRVVFTNGVYSFIGIQNNSSQPIGGTGTISKSTLSALVTYQKLGFGSLQVDGHSASPSDATAFHAQFLAGTQSPWLGLPNVYCHLNDVPVTPAAGWYAMNPAPVISNSASRNTALWTGSKMIVNPAGTSQSGLFDPVTNSWTTINSGLPSNSGNCRPVVWTGSKMIVWTGYQGAGVSTGTVYDPVTNISTPITDVGAPQVSGNSSGQGCYSTVWTGSQLIVFGGEAGGGNGPSDVSAYDPATGIWTTQNPSGGPGPHVGHTAIWTGSKMIVWGGWHLNSGYTMTLTGSLYDPQNGGSWTAMTVPSPNVAPSGSSTVWTGSKMIVWGGRNPNTYNEGSIYDSVQNTWSATSTVDAPVLAVHTAVWTGSKMIVFGGFDAALQIVNTSAIFDPESGVGGTWSSVTTNGISPGARVYHQAVWTGTQMIVWGGMDPTGPYLNTGDILVPY